MSTLRIAHKERQHAAVILCRQDAEVSAGRAESGRKAQSIADESRQSVDGRRQVHEIALIRRFIVGTSLRRDVVVV